LLIASNANRRHQRNKIMCARRPKCKSSKCLRLRFLYWNSRCATAETREPVQAITLDTSLTNAMTVIASSAAPNHSHCEGSEWGSACASNGGRCSVLTLSSRRPTAWSPLTVPTSLQPVGAFGRTVQASWQDGEGGRLEGFVPEIAGEVVTGAEISYSYRQRCFRGFEWRLQRKARLEEEGRVKTNSRSTRRARTTAATRTGQN
jgi:hypothetical protein